MRGSLLYGLLSSAQRQAVIFSASKTTFHASRTARPHISRLSRRASTPEASAISNSGAEAASFRRNRLQVCFSDPASLSSVLEKYPSREAARTFFGSTSKRPLFLADKSKNSTSGNMAAYAAAVR